MDELEERVPGFDQQLKLNATGCIDSCAQRWIADIDLEGKKIKLEGQMVDAYYFSLSGAVGEFQRPARGVGYRRPATEVPDAISRFRHTYLASGSENGNLRAFFVRFSGEELRAQLAGRADSVVTGDLSSGRVSAWVGN